MHFIARVRNTRRRPSPCPTPIKFVLSAAIAAAAAPLNIAPRIRHPFQQLAFAPITLSMMQMLARCLSASGSFRHPSCCNNCSPNIHLSSPSSFLSSPSSFSGALPLRLLLLLLLAAASPPHASALPLSSIAPPTQFFVSPIGDDSRGDGRLEVLRLLLIHARACGLCRHPGPSSLASASTAPSPQSLALKQRVTRLSITHHPSSAHPPHTVRSLGPLSSDVSVLLRNGSYFISDTVTFTPRDGGSGSSVVRYAS
jgi:hypothetical protein